MKTVIGIDPSLTGSAVAVFSGQKFINSHRFTSKPADGLRGRIARYDWLAYEISEFVEKCRPDVMVIEGYAYGARYSYEEFGGILRLKLCCALDEAEQVCAFHECSPSTLKKFVLGKGVGDKDLILQQVLKRWSYEAPDNDAADAYSLARLGLVIAGVCEPENQAQQEAVDVVVNGKAKKARKRKAATNDT